MLLEILVSLTAVLLFGFGVRTLFVKGMTIEARVKLCAVCILLSFMVAYFVKFI